MRRVLALNDRFWPVFTLSLVAIVTALTLSPMPEVQLPDPVSGDKVQHFLAFGAIAFPVALARPRAWLLLLIAIIGWGAVIELIQPHVGRHGSVEDAAANAVGVLAGTGAAVALRRLVDLLSPADRGSTPRVRL